MLGIQNTKHLNKASLISGKCLIPWAHVNPNIIDPNENLKAPIDYQVTSYNKPITSFHVTTY
jgi:hypothetical protein